MLCEIDANQFFFMSEKHEFFFFHKMVAGWGMRCSFLSGDFIFRWYGPPNGAFQKIIIELEGGGYA